MLSAALSLLFLLPGVYLLRSRKKAAYPEGEQPALLTRERILRDLRAPFLHQLAFVLLILSGAGLLLLKRPGIFTALSLAFLFLTACGHASALISCRAVRAGRFIVRSERARVETEYQYGGTGSRVLVHRVRFGDGADRESFLAEDFPGRGAAYYKNGGRYYVVAVNGRVARVYLAQNFRLDPSLPREE